MPPKSGKLGATRISPKSFDVAPEEESFSLSPPPRYSPGGAAEAQAETATLVILPSSESRYEQYQAQRQSRRRRLFLCSMLLFVVLLYLKSGPQDHESANKVESPGWWDAANQRIDQWREHIYPTESEKELGVVGETEQVGEPVSQDVAGDANDKPTETTDNTDVTVGDVSTVSEADEESESEPVPVQVDTESPYFESESESDVHENVDEDADSESKSDVPEDVSANDPTHEPMDDAGDELHTEPVQVEAEADPMDSETLDGNDNDANDGDDDLVDNKRFRKVVRHLGQSPH